MFWAHPDLRRRALQEFQTVSALQSPNIVRVLEPHWDQDPPAVAMEYVDGMSLEEFQSRLPYVLPEVAALILIEVLRALEYAHSQGVIHRDLKPANILVGNDGRVLVSDFGLAKIRDVTQHTLSGAVLGSPDYMSPEQARGDLITPSSDLFSAASILYFLITGTRPFTRQTPLATLAAVADVAISEPAGLRNPKLSTELGRILKKGLEQNPKNRFKSATEFKAALESYLDGIGLTRAEFIFQEWIRSSSEITIASLQLISANLIPRVESQIQSGEWSQALESLSHLSQVAPASPSIPRLMQELERARSRARIKKAVLPIFLSFLLIGAGIGLVRHWMGASAPRALVATIAPTPPSPEAPKVKARVKVALPKPSRRGIVHFDVSPEIQVKWDGRPIDPSQEIKNALVGEHDLILEMPGKTPIRQRVTVSSVEPTLIRAR